MDPAGFCTLKVNLCYYLAICELFFENLMVELEILTRCFIISIILTPTVPR